MPRAAVGYSVLEYNRARGETNTTAFELEGEEKRAYEELELVDWNLFPPKLVTTYAYGEILSFTTMRANPLTPSAAPAGRWDEQVSLPRLVAQQTVSDRFCRARRSWSLRSDRMYDTSRHVRTLRRHCCL